VLRYLGSFANPEDLAFRRPAPLLPLYHVRFDARALWPNQVSADEVLIELYGSWLQAEVAPE
jgi:nitrile hydratase